VSAAKGARLPGRGLVLLATFCLFSTIGAAPQTDSHLEAPLRFEVSIAAGSAQGAVTGRIFVVVAKTREPEPREQVGDWQSHVQFLGTDVNGLAPGAAAVIDADTLGFPFKSLRELEPGDYFVQALLNVYTEFHRSDGHTIWAHMDQWEGQQFNASPGNLYSAVQKVHLDPQAGYNLKLSLTQIIAPIEMPPDTAQVKHVKIESKLLSAFWGRPIFLGATVLLPQGYDAHPQVRYPVIYVQDHFNLRPPFSYTREQRPLSAAMDERLTQNGIDHWMTGFEFHQRWDGAGFPRMVAVTFQHPTPYFDDSYAVNSANNGPYGDALLTELVPYLEKRFRIIAKPYARVLTGGSTGGWESLALQVLHPEFFGGTWTFYPDPIDFTRYQLVNIYKDENAFLAPGYEPPVPERPLERTAEGQVDVTMRQMSQFEQVLGTHGRSGQQLEAWEAVYGPTDEDGYPKPLWDKMTGKIDRGVAAYMRDHGYDLRAHLEKNWTALGPQLVGKIHVYVGDMDNYYLNLAVYRMQDFLKHTRSPHYEGTFDYGRPMKGHGWSPMDNAELVRQMGTFVAKHAPKSEDVRSWQY
jgi:hypothetical protein